MRRRLTNAPPRSSLTDEAVGAPRWRHPVSFICRQGSGRSLRPKSSFRLRTRPALEIGCVLVGLALILSPILVDRAEAFGDVEYYRTYPSLDSSGLYQYGMHFGETSASYGGRDFNRPSDANSGQAVYHRVQLSKTYAEPLVFKLTHIGSCTVRAEAGYMAGQPFMPYADQRFHFLHLNNASRVANNTVTTGMTQINASVYQFVGNVEAADEQCQPGAAHLHQSANIAPNTGVYRNIIYTSGETCWSNTEGTNTWQCAATYYKTHASSPDSHGGCGSYTGYTGVLSGATTGEYNCELWSYAGQTTLAQWPSATKVFYVMGPN